jgi:acylphosphatase
MKKSLVAFLLIIALASPTWPANLNRAFFREFTPDDQPKSPGPEAKSETQRREVYFSGRVQGVGFRQTTFALARKLKVTGFVKNLRDGRVQLIVEGQPKEIESILTSIRKTMGKNIKKTEETTKRATGEFKGFAIRY